MQLNLDAILKPHRSSSRQKLRFPDELPLEVRATLT